MKNLISYKIFESKEDNILLYYFNNRDYNEILKILSIINENNDKFAARKSDNIIFNTILKSQLFKFYKSFNNYNGSRVSMMPYNKLIYFYEDILNKINTIMDDIDTSSLFYVILRQLKDLIVYLSYFDEIRNGLNKRYNIDDEFKRLFYGDKDYDDIEKEITDKENPIRISLFFCDSYQPIFIIEKSYLNTLNYIETFEKRGKRVYNIIYNKYLKDNTLEDKLYYFKKFYDDYNWDIKNAFPNRFIEVSYFKNDKLIDNNININFTGDFITDYNLYNSSFEKYRYK